MKKMETQLGEKVMLHAYLKGNRRPQLFAQAVPSVHLSSSSSPCFHLATSLVEPSNFLSGNHLPCSPEHDPYHSLA